MEETVTLTRDSVVRLNPMYLFRWEEAQKAHILLYPEGVVKLNATAAVILEQCTGTAIGTIIERLNEMFATDVSKDVMAFLEVACDKDWVRTDA